MPDLWDAEERVGKGSGYLFPDQVDGLGHRDRGLPFGGGGGGRDLGELQDGDGVGSLTSLTFESVPGRRGSRLGNRGHFLTSLTFPDIGERQGFRSGNRGHSPTFLTFPDIPEHQGDRGRDRDGSGWIRVERPDFP